MKKHLVTLLFAGLAAGLCAQNLPVKHVTLFKNGKSLLYKSGTVPVKGGQYSVTELPDALYGTYWVSSPGGELSSVFAAVDSVDDGGAKAGLSDILRLNLGKQMIVYVAGNGSGEITIQGTAERLMLDVNRSEYLVLKNKSGAWSTVNIYTIRNFDILETPNFNFGGKKARKHLDVRFKGAKTEQEIGLSYLTERLGWVPVYRLDLNDKTRGRLALRAEIANDAEDLGNAELRLAVGIPNFAFANKTALLVDFGEVASDNFAFNQDLNPYRGNMYASGRISNQLLSQKHLPFAQSNCDGA